jgi:hypothetical protein
LAYSRYQAANSRNLAGSVSSSAASHVRRVRRYISRGEKASPPPGEKEGKASTPRGVPGDKAGGRFVSNIVEIEVKDFTDAIKMARH